MRNEVNRALVAKKKVFLLITALTLSVGLWSGNTITYNATEKLDPTYFSSDGSTIYTLQENATTFGPEIISHEFANGLGTITCDGEITTIGENAFNYCHALSLVTIPNSVTMVGKMSFFNCKGLTSVTIPNSVKTIGYQAFTDCSGLTSVTIPNSVTTIEDGVFYMCPSLVDVYVSWIEDIPTPAMDAFEVSQRSECTLHFPQGTADLYVDAGWNRWFDLIGQAYKDGRAEALGDMGEPCTDCTAVEVKKGDKTVILYAPESVTYIKTAE